ncbi:MAG: UvrD-helicase domain-containing protein [Planctomycetota bacterium]|nr:UvrD-helicase domain-containing protein [Planctomycetota bacterium]
MESIVKDLTDQQREAVLHKDGPLLILAGAGTGKTRVITRRIAALVHSGVKADRILAITFTNKAAGEMRERTERLVGGFPTVTTFHSFGARLLRRHAELVGLDKHFTIFDDADQKACVKEAAAEAKVDTESWSPKVLIAGISSAKNKLLSPKEMEELAITPKQRAVALVYPRYQSILRNRNGADFDDLLVLTTQLLKTDENVRRLWADWYRYVLIDEYQDTNHVQYSLAMSLAKEHRNLCVTGDPDQSIYGWRGADIANILNFERDFTDTKVIPLTKNFRSTQKILDAANRLISFNIRRKEKDLEGVNGDGEPIEVKNFDSAEEESYFVARSIQSYRQKGGSLGEVAVLYRANFQSRLIEEGLVHRGMPYQVVGAVAFYQRKEVKDLLAYLRVLVNSNDDFGALRIINTPPRRIGAASLRKMNDSRRGKGISLLECCEALDGVGLGSRATKAVTAWAAMMRGFREFSENTSSVAEVLREIVEKIEYKAHLEKIHPDEPDRFENIHALIDAAAEFDRDCLSRMGKPEPQEGDGPMQHAGPEPSVSGFLEHVSLVSAVDDLDDDDEAKRRERISLMTVHTAKGLEFDKVFIVGLEDGIFPNSRALEESWGMEEERRLAYVAITRARLSLTLTYNRCRTRFGQFEVLDPSPFLHESGAAPEPKKKRFGRDAFDDYSQVPSTWDDDSPAKNDSRSRWRLPPIKNPAKKKPLSKYAPSPMGRKLKPGPRTKSAFTTRAKDVKDPFKAGDRVKHEIFGEGDVSSVTGYGPGTRVKVRFDRHGEKTLVLQYARLHKI